jgi:hypothetical protein
MESKPFRSPPMSDLSRRLYELAFHPNALFPGDGRPLLTVDDALAVLAELVNERDELRAEIETWRPRHNATARELMETKHERDRLRTALVIGNKMMGSMNGPDAPPYTHLWLQFEVALADLVNDGLLDTAAVVDGLDVWSCTAGETSCCAYHRQGVPPPRCLECGGTIKIESVERENMKLRGAAASKGLIPIDQAVEAVMEWWRENRESLPNFNDLPRKSE